MLFLSFIYAIFFLQIGKSLSEQGLAVWRDPRFWVQILLLSVITGVLQLE